MTYKFKTLATLATAFLPLSAIALTGVNPTGLNVRTTGPSTAFITFLGTEGQTSTDAFWCGAVSAPAGTVTDFNPCVPGTECGRLPARHDFSRQSGTGGNTNFTDIMTIPASISRCAYQDARSGSPSSFFYIRRFVDENGAEQYTSVTCRLSGGGARSPLALTHVDMYFKAAQGNRPVYLLPKGAKAPSIEARINYTGSGRLKGRWELVQPGDIEPTEQDLLPEASLPIELRGSQQRYRLLSRFNVFLPPSGKGVIPGPNPELIPTDLEGPFKILLRIEASKDREGNSNTGAGVIGSAGVAGFPMPVLRYYVGSAEQIEKTQERLLNGSLDLFLPLDGRSFNPSSPIEFSWIEVQNSQRYKLEVRSETDSVLSAYVEAGRGKYTAPPWLEEHSGEALLWRVQALGEDGQIIAQSVWREFLIK